MIVHMHIIFSPLGDFREIFTPRACARGKVIGRVVVVLVVIVIVVVVHKKLPDLGI